MQICVLRPNKSIDEFNFRFVCNILCSNGRWWYIKTDTSTAHRILYLIKKLYLDGIMVHANNGIHAIVHPIYCVFMLCNMYVIICIIFCMLLLFSKQASSHFMLFYRLSSHCLYASLIIHIRFSKTIDRLKCLLHLNLCFVVKCITNYFISSVLFFSII